MMRQKFIIIEFGVQIYFEVYVISVGVSSNESIETNYVLHEIGLNIFVTIRQCYTKYKYSKPIDQY